MKAKTALLWVCAMAMAVMISTAALADDNGDDDREQAARSRQSVRQRGPAGTPADRGRAAAQRPTDREQMYRDAIARRMEMHNQEISKLEAILKIAEDENAERTVEALKALIAEKNQAVQDQVKQAEQRRREIQERLQERRDETPEAGEGRQERQRPAPQPQRRRPSD